MDLAQQIKVDFEKAFSTKGTPVSDRPFFSLSLPLTTVAMPDIQKGTKAELHDACLVMETLGGQYR